MSHKAPPPRSWLERIGAVFHRSLDRSALPSPAGALGPADGRPSLKEAVARKRRNDAVRNDELNHLRELMRERKAAHGVDGVAAPSSSLKGLTTLSAFSSTLQLDAGQGSHRSRTINEIARIESQMAQHWQQRGLGPEVGGARVVATRLAHALDRDLAQSQHLRARSKGSTVLPRDAVTASQPTTGQELSAALTEPALAQAAQAFAQGKDDAAARTLRALVTQTPLSLTARVAAMALLDLHHARGEFEPFDELAAEFAERFGAPVPRWPTEARRSRHMGAAVGPSDLLADPTAPEGAQGRIWVCPLVLDLQAVSALERLVAAADAPVWLDWTGLLSADLPAARALLAQVQGWLRHPLELRLVGAAVLRRRLKASTPSGRSENDAVWWLLRLALLCLMGRRDEFDLAALDYCVTYGVLPPEWEQPQCRLISADSLPAPAPASLAPPPPLEQAGAGYAPAANSSWGPAYRTAALSGHLVADGMEQLAGLDAALAQHPPGAPFVLDCGALLRIDLVAASALMQCLLAARQRGVAVELHGLSRLLAAYFHNVGLDEIATLRLRQY